MKVETFISKNLTKSAILAVASISALALSSCAPTAPPTPNPEQKNIPKAVFVNPYLPGTYQHFISESSYPKTYKVFKNEAALAAASPGETNVIIDLGLQRGILKKGDQILMDYPIASGKRQFPTPTGSYKVLEKLEKDKRSNLYGKIYDAEGKVVNSDADSSKDEIPEGGRFEGALMSYWMRITWDGIGMHQGRVPRYPASHGCIRHPRSVVKTVFSKVKVGTPVVVQD